MFFCTKLKNACKLLFVLLNLVMMYFVYHSILKNLHNNTSKYILLCNKEIHSFSLYKLFLF